MHIDILLTGLTSITLGTAQLFHYFAALAALLIAANGFGYLFTRFRLPRVVGEILGGIVLGPTLLGFLLPETYSFLFDAFATEGQLLSAVYWLGLVLLMFVSGFELQKSIDRKDGKIIGILMLCSTAIPFIAGWLIFSSFDFSYLLGTKGNILALQVVFATSVAITSIPVISKIFLDLGLMKTRFAKIVLGAATIHDVILYVALAVATGMIENSGTSLYSIVIIIATTVLFFAFSIIVVSKLIRFASGSRYNFMMKASSSGYLLFVCFIFAAVATMLGVNVMFGAFLAGICFGLMPGKMFEQEKKSIREVSMSFLVPLYFAMVGLQIDLIHSFDISFFIAFLVVSTILEMLGTLVAARISKLDTESSFNLAVVMNARGGPGIVLATVAFGLGIINENFFATLVMTAIVTSLFAGWWLKSRARPGKELLVTSG
jgi:Kef-type K+ transport system membrane component KefB